LPKAKLSVAYVGTAGIHLPSVLSANGYTGPRRSSRLILNLILTGRVTGRVRAGISDQQRSHSIYHALQTSVTQNQSKIGLSFQASYTFSKSLDDTSAIIGGPPVSTGTILQERPRKILLTLAQTEGGPHLM